MKLKSTEHKQFPVQNDIESLQGNKVGIAKTSTEKNCLFTVERKFSFLWTQRHLSSQYLCDIYILP